LDGARIHLLHFRGECGGFDTASLRGDPVGNRPSLGEALGAHAGAMPLGRVEVRDREAVGIFVENDAEDAFRGFLGEEPVLDVPGSLYRIALENVAISTATVVGVGKDIAGLVRSCDVGPL